MNNNRMSMENKCKKNMSKLMLGLVGACTLVTSWNVLGGKEVSACTAVYVGSEASDDGTVMIARSNDYPDSWPNYVVITDKVENQAGRKMPVDNGQTVFAEIPATTYRYTSTPWMDSATSYNGLESDAAACTNEYGVGMTMSISAFANEKALEADPLVENGLTEFTADDLVICQSKTAREAVEVLCSLIDQYGSSECNIALITDQKEAWYVEMYSGHQYAAVKLPADKVSVFGNEFTMEYLSDYEDAIVSEKLMTLPEEKGFAVYGKDGEINLLDTYAGEEVLINYSHMRTWIGHKLLNDSYGDYDLEERYPLCFDADHAVSLKEVMSIMRDRFEGTPYSPDEQGRTDMRVIGTDTALSVHVLQIYPDLPAEMSAVTWECTGPAIYGAFVPVSCYATEISEPYSLNQSADDFGVFDTDTYPWYAFKELTTLCVSDVSVYGNPVREYWTKAESDMISGMKEVLAEASKKDQMTGQQEVTQYCNQVQEQAFADAKQLLNDVRWYMSKNCNTMKNGRNPETHEVLDELRVIPPLEVQLDGTGYQKEA